MYELTKEYRFSAAHRLLNLRKGHKCGNLHGHNYSLIVSVKQKSDTTDSRGFVIDYNELDKLIQPIVDKLDHTTLVSFVDETLINFCISQGSEYCLFPTENTSCELLGRSLYFLINNILLKKLKYCCSCSVTLKEGERTSCTVSDVETDIVAVFEAEEIKDISGNVIGRFNHLHYKSL